MLLIISGASHMLAIEKERRRKLTATFLRRNCVGHNLSPFVVIMCTKLRKTGDKQLFAACFLLSLYRSSYKILLDTQLLSNLLGKRILVDNNVHSLVSNECLSSVEHTLVRTVFTP